ncbi:MAG TPA: DUF3072 domain-containing protein [Pyrinomonadaceae bacterium]|nr:DUF3072 domain-containing protein [Pyrinomonadaceae bacterium]
MKKLHGKATSKRIPTSNLSANRHSVQVALYRVQGMLTRAEPVTGAQKSYLKTLSDKAGEDAPEAQSKAEAAQRIDALQKKTGRGKD